MSKKNWFYDTFLPSMVERMENNVKYPNSVILSEKQGAVCKNNMQLKSSVNDGGITIYRSYYYECETNGYRFTMTKRGKYTVLYVVKVQTSEQKQRAHEISKEIERLETILDDLYEQNRADKIEALENQIDELWTKYNACFKVVQSCSVLRGLSVKSPIPWRLTSKTAQ